MILATLFILGVGSILFSGAALGTMGVSGGIMIFFDLLVGLALAGLAGFIL